MSDIYNKPNGLKPESPTQDGGRDDASFQWAAAASDKNENICRKNTYLYLLIQFGVIRV